MEPMTLGNMRALFVINAEYARRSLQLIEDQPEGRAPEGSQPEGREPEGREPEAPANAAVAPNHTYQPPCGQEGGSPRCGHRDGQSLMPWSRQDGLKASPKSRRRKLQLSQAL